MCGILGYISERVILDEPDFRRALSLMSHRGPDAEGILKNGNCFLGHKRLSIIDLSESANQPMYSAGGKYAIVYNGEVYNFKELAKEYNIVQKTSSDTEVILKMYELYGKDFPKYLNGMFSFCIIDREENEIYLARDRAGIKPLFYYSDDNIFAFASELKALRAIPYISKNLSVNYSAVKTYLQLGYIPQPQTIYNNIYKFPSGHYATVNRGRITFSEYWNTGSLIEENVIPDENSALEKLELLLTDSIKKRLICDVPFGVLLSGGIDSSLVTSLATKVSDTKIKTYTIGFSDSGADESDYARMVAKHLGTIHYEYFVTEKDAVELIPEIINCYDEPYADSSAIPTMLVSRMASIDVKMVLSGDGGDELFHGYGAYKWANRLNNNYLKKAAGPINKLLKTGGNKYKRVSGLFDFGNETCIEPHIFSQEQYFFSAKEINKITTDRLSGYDTFLYEREALKRNLTPAENQALFDINYYLKDDLLVKVDRASMKYSLEVRVPFLDYRVISFALNLHPELKIRNGEMKYLLKRLLYKHCPAAIFKRPKKGFSVPLNKWLLNDLNYLIPEYLSEKELIRTGILKPDEVASLIKSYHSGRQYLYNRIWNLIILQQFLLKQNFL